MGDAKLSYRDVRDIASVAVKALGGECDGRILEPNGPEALTLSEVAAKISKQAGVSATFVGISEEAERKAMLDAGMPEWQVTALQDLHRYFTSGHGGDVDDTVKRLLGRPPITMDKFLKEFASEFRGQSAKA